MKNKTFIIISLVLIILLFPTRSQYKDGGSIEYKSLTYSVTKVHKFAPIEDMERGKIYCEGIIIKIFDIKIFDNVK